MGTGNQVSAEFNLIYRWHGNLSVKDEAWTQDFMQDLFPGQDFTKLPLLEFLRRLGKWKDRALAQKPETRTFGNLKRNSSGTFDTKELVSLIAQSTQDVSGMLSFIHINRYLPTLR
jgi:linoleate 8R-lipoxygenase / 9,12-octadecadienoate 8-hydroperoxide 8R-isomerase